MAKKVCKCGHAQDLHGTLTGACFVKDCSCVLYQSKPAKEHIPDIGNMKAQYVTEGTEPAKQVVSNPEQMMICSECKGVGHCLLASMGTAKVCPACNGTGKLSQSLPAQPYIGVEAHEKVYANAQPALLTADKLAIVFFKQKYSESEWCYIDLATKQEYIDLAKEFIAKVSASFSKQLADKDKEIGELKAEIQSLITHID